MAVHQFCSDVSTAMTLLPKCIIRKHILFSVYFEPKNDKDGGQKNQDKQRKGWKMVETKTNFLFISFPFLSKLFHVSSKGFRAVIINTCNGLTEMTKIRQTMLTNF